MCVCVCVCVSGSGATFHIADPTSRWWQERYAQVVARLVHDIGVDGVYLDQLAAAAPALDFSAGRAHGAGGGAWWSRGVREMLAAIRTHTPSAPMVTEGNAEDKIGVVQGMLTLASFDAAFARNGTDPPGIHLR